MKFFKRSPRKNAKVSLILLDWSVRESPHIIHYLRDQTVSPDDIEVIYIEFYDREFEGLRQYEDRVDIWVALEMPKDVYYAKHLMYNAGIVLASGELVVICDVDALVRPTFIERMILAFDRDPNIVLHIDQFRNMRREYYPFNFPSLAAVAGEGCINDAGGVTTGILDHEDPIHTRNYGSCFCARRADVIAIGGADMHIDYVGHICGPYDLTFRLRNLGRRIVWAEDEFMYHTWHPGTDGGDNYLGPHDGRNLSTTAMEFVADGEVKPLHESPAITYLRTTSNDVDSALDQLIEPFYFDHWRMPILIERAPRLRLDAYRTPLGVADGVFLVRDKGTIVARPLAGMDMMVSPSLNPWIILSTDLFFGVFRFFELTYELATTSVPRRVQQFSGPRWVRTVIWRPLLTLLIPIPMMKVVFDHLKNRRLFGRRNSRDLTNSLRNLVSVMRQFARQGARSSEIRVVHDSRSVLSALHLLRGLRVVPAFTSVPIKGGEELGTALAAAGAGPVTIVPSGLYIQYHLDVPPIGYLRNTVVV